MASGDRLQVVLEARDEITSEIRKATKSIKGLEAEQRDYAKAAESGNKEAAVSHERVRREILDQREALEDLKAEQRIVAREAAKLAREEATARVKAKLAAKQQASAMGGVAAATARVTGTVRVQARAWDVLKMKVSYAASVFKAKWSAAIASVSAKMSALQSQLAAAGAGALGLLRSGGMAVGLAGVGLGIVGIKTASQLEQSQIAFEQLLGSGKKAREMVQWLSDTAAKTPFDLPGLTDATQQLLAYGFSAEQAKANLMTIGDAAAATGKGREGVEAITRALGQMQSKQKIQSAEMLQLTEAGIPAWELLAEKMKMTVPDLQAKVQLPGGGNEIFKAGGLDKLLAGMNDRYAGLMDKQSRTLGGRLSTLWDTLNVGMAKTLKKSGIIKALKVAITSLTEWLPKAFKSAREVIERFREPVVKVITFIRDNKEAFIAAAGAIGVMTVAMGALAIAANATGIPAIIFAIGALVGLIVLAYKRVDWFRNAVDTAFRWIRKAVAWFVDWFKAYAWPVLRAIFKVWVAYMRNVVWPVIRFVFRAVAGVIKVVWAYISKVWWPGVRGVFRLFIGAARGLWSGAKWAWDKITSVFRSAKERIGTILDGIKSFFGNLWSGLTDGLPAAIETMKQWLSKIPGLGALVDGFLFTGGPAMAGGTYMVGELGPEMVLPRSGSPYMVGENGPEVRKFSTSGFVVPNHLLQASGTSTVTRERTTERVVERGPLVENLVVRSEADAMRELARMRARESRIARERGA